jgi:predicted DNA-binding protein YlxM (UPF0122 family)
MKSIVSQLDEISRLYHDEGLTRAQIVERLGISSQSVSYHVKRGNLVLEKETLDRDELTRLRLEERLSIVNIAKRLTTHAQRVSRELKRQGIFGQRYVRRPDPLDRGDLRRLYVDERLSVDEVAARMGVSAHKIRLDLGRAGIATRRYTAKPGSSVPHVRLAPVIKLGRGLPKTADKYNIQVDSRTVKGVTYKVIGMPEVSRLYHEERLTVRDIADILGVSPTAIYGHINRRNLVLDRSGRVPRRLKKTLDEAVLRGLYLEERMTTNDIAQRLSTTRAVVVRELDRFGIRRPGERNGRGRPPIDGEELRRLYTEERLCVREIAARLRIKAHMARSEMIRLGIERRGNRGARKYEWMPGMKVGDQVTIEVDAWRERPPSGLRKAADRNGIKLKAERVGEGKFRVRRIK